MAKFNYGASSGPSYMQFDNPSCPCPSFVTWDSRYGLGSRGGLGDFPGPFNVSDATIVTKFVDICDGLSSTIFFGETRPACSALVNGGWAIADNVDGAFTTVVPINYDSCNQQPGMDADGQSCHSNCNWSMEYGFRSMHPGGVHFLFGDGAVHFLNGTIDHQAYQYLGGKSDGHPVVIP
jgi:hypothetical protein